MFGLFGKKGKCSICGVDTKKEIADGFICSKCLDQAKSNLNAIKNLKITSVSEIKEAIEKSKQDEIDIKNFKTTRKVKGYILFDDENKKIMFPKSILKLTKAKIYNYSEIIEYEILEDGESITKGGLGRAVVGGVLLGGVGAVVGGLTGGKTTKRKIKTFQVKIVLDNLAHPVEYIDMLNGSETKSDSFIYKAIKKDAEDIVAILAGILNEKSKETITESTETSITSGADEILKYKKLLDEGIITEEEFLSKKKQILGL